MKKVVILSGTFSAKGNFSAYDDDNEQYFVHKRLMEANGWSEATPPTFPFYAKASVKHIGQLDESGEPLVDAQGIAVTVARLQINSVFKTREALIANCVEKVALDIDISSAISKVATTAGMTQASVDALLAVSI